MASTILFQNASFQLALKLFILITGLGIFYIDTVTSLGITSGSAFTICIFMCYWVKESKAVFVVAIICCILILAGYTISPEAVFSSTVVVFNRTFSVFSVLLSAVFTYKFRITTLKHLENGHELRATLESASESILIINREGKIIYTNERTREIFGYAQDELIGSNIEILVPPELRDKHLLLREQFAQNPSIWHNGSGKNFEAVRKNNSRFPVQINLGYFNTHKGFFVTCFITDISLRKSAEDALHNTNLELQETNQRLKILNADIEQFLYATSHEMQEPIRMIASYAQMLEKKYPDKLDLDKKEYRNIIRKEARRMKQLLVAVSEYISLNVDADYTQTVNCTKVLQEVQGLLKQEIEESGAQIKIVNELPIVHGNRFQLIKLFSELIENAIKFRSSALPLILISWKENPDEYQFTIKDNGTSLDQKYEDYVFKIFKKLNVYEENHGPGIGLAIAYKIVTQHGGKIWYDSNLGEGTTFYFTLRK